jgi:hypothetical protein
LIAIVTSQHAYMEIECHKRVEQNTTGCTPPPPLVALISLAALHAIMHACMPFTASCCRLAAMGMRMSRSDLLLRHVSKTRLLFGPRYMLDKKPDASSG